MSAQGNMAIINRYWAELNKGNLAHMDECFAANFANLRNDGTVIDKEGYKQLNARLLRRFPDLHVNVERMIGEGDEVAFWFTLTGTDLGGLEGNAPTGKRLTIKEAYFADLDSGKITQFRHFQAERRFE
jgi:steroid delta-isomerase-like uncharacterized protein